MVAITYSLIATALAPRAEVSTGAALTSGGAPSMPVPAICTQRTPVAIASTEWGPHPPNSTSPRMPGGTPSEMSTTPMDGNRDRIRSTEREPSQNTTTADCSGADSDDTTSVSRCPVGRSNGHWRHATDAPFRNDGDRGHAVTGPASLTHMAFTWSRRSGCSQRNAASAEPAGRMNGCFPPCIPAARTTSS